MKTLPTYLAAAGLAIAASGVVPTGAARADQTKPVVVELFTSQGCYSCPPAEKFLGELAGRADVVALEFHVDYWDQLVYGSAGKWKDVFSKHEHTQRQRDYNLAIRDKSNVYTPQMVIDGEIETVGSHESVVRNAVRRLSQAGGDKASVAVTRTAGGFAIDIQGGKGAPAAVWLVRFLKAENTRVTSGENKGKALKSHNIVTDMRRVGAWSGTAMRLDLPDPGLSAREGCAILVQGETPGPILGAANCPAAEAS